MKKTSKLGSLLLALVMVAVLVTCANGANDNAQNNQNNYDVSFNDNFPTGVDTTGWRKVNPNIIRNIPEGKSIADKDEMPIPPRDPSLVWKFNGWNTAPDGSDNSPFDESTKITNNIDVYAQWKESTPATWSYIVTFDPLGGNWSGDTAAQTKIVSSPNTNVNQSGGMPESPTRDGFTFSHWTWNGSDFTGATSVTGNITVYAYWTANQGTTWSYTITFNGNEGSGHYPSSIMVSTPNKTIGQTGEMPSDPTRDGYDFAGWTLNNVPFDRDTEVTGNITVYAQWTPGQNTTWSHIVTFNPDGGNWSGSTAAQTKTVNSPNTNVSQSGGMPTDPTKDGFTFNRWTWNGSDFTGTTSVTSNIIVMAQWTQNQTITYTVTFNANGGTLNGAASITVQSGESAGSQWPTNPTPPQGQTFNGWNTQANGTGQSYGASTLINSSVTVYAQYTGTPSPTTYTVTFDAGGGTLNGSGSITVQSGQSIQSAGAQMPTASKGTDTFNGWFTAQNGGTQFYANTPVTQTITVYAQYTPIAAPPSGYVFPYSHVAGGTPMTVAEGSGDIRVEVYPGDGETSETGTRIGFGDFPLGAIQYIDKGGSVTWTIAGDTADRNVTFIMNYAGENAATGANGLTVTVNGATQPTKLQFPASGGWTVASAINSSSYGPFPLKGNQNNTIALGGFGVNIRSITLTVAGETPTPTTYTVTFNANGGNLNGSGSITVQSGQSIQSAGSQMPTASKGTDTFNGWYTDQNNGTQFYANTPVTGNMTVWARWTPGTVTTGPRYPAYEGLVMAGYQGWFNTDGDGSRYGDNAENNFIGWRHYDLRDPTGNDPRTCTIDFWPDMTEYTQKYEVPNKWFKMSNGSPAYLYSPYDEESVDLHFKWMQQYGIDGVWMQRFVGEVGPGARKANFNKVLENALKAAKKYDRAIGIMYDLSGSKSADLQNILEADWDDLQTRFHLNDYNVNPTYIHQNGKPMVAIWGVGFNDNRQYNTADVQATVNRLKAKNYSIMLGVPYWWESFGGDTEDNPNLHNLIRGCDVIMPWAVGRYGNSGDYNNPGHSGKRTADTQWANQNGVICVPLVFPGFSWANMISDANFASKYNEIPRNRGEFLWMQIAGAKAAGAISLYVAMFDEIDEGTAIFKCAVEGPGSSLNNLPIFSNPNRTGEKFIGIDADLGSDYYLWLVGEGAKWFHGQGGYGAAKPNR